MRISISMLLGTLFVLGTGSAMAAPACSAHTPRQAIQSGQIGQAEWKTQISIPLTLSSAAPMPSSTPISTSDSYRLRRIVMDPVLHRRWAFVENCSHPEAPLLAIALPAKVASAGSQASGSAVLPAEQDSAAEKISAAPTPTVPYRLSYAPAIVQRGMPSSATIVSTNVSAPVFSSAADPSSAILVRAGDCVHLWSSQADVRLEIEVVALEYGRAGQVIHLRREGQEALLAGVVVGKDSAELMP